MVRRRCLGGGQAGGESDRRRGLDNAPARGIVGKIGVVALAVFVVLHLLSCCCMAGAAGEQ
jgi:hypothetical protein